MTRNRRRSYIRPERGDARPLTIFLVLMASVLIAVVLAAAFVGGMVMSLGMS